jgi:hypothetical protein
LKLPVKANKPFFLFIYIMDCGEIKVTDYILWHMKNAGGSPEEWQIAFLCNHAGKPYDFYRYMLDSL